MIVPLPAAFAARVAGQDAADRNAAEVSKYADEDEAVMRARVRVHQAHVFEAQHGCTQGEWLAAQQAVQFAKGDMGFDASAPLGSERHPEPLLDGESVCRPAVGGAARRSSRDLVAADKISAEELARRVAFEAEAGGEVIRRAKTVSRRRDIAELERELERERGQARGAATSSASGRMIARSFTAGGPAPARPAVPPHVRLPVAEYADPGIRGDWERERQQRQAQRGDY